MLTSSELSRQPGSIFKATRMVFNTGQVAAQTYNQVEVVVDPSFPGNVIPTCPVGSPAAQKDASTIR